MKEALLKVWAWILANPAEVLGALYLVLNVVNSRIPVEKREGSTLYKLLDALCVATQKGAASKASWPVVGRSIARDVAVSMTIKPESKDPPPASPGYAEQRVLSVIAGAALVGALALALSGCSPTLPADLYRGVGVGVAVTASGGRELALLEARECLAKPSRSEAEACLVPWRGRWSAIAQAWQGAASRAQSLAHVVASVDAQLERRWPAMDAGVAPAADAAVSE